VAQYIGRLVRAQEAFEHEVGAGDVVFDVSQHSTAGRIDANYEARIALGRPVTRAEVFFFELDLKQA
jgi:hypothetical protein